MSLTGVETTELLGLSARLMRSSSCSILRGDGDRHSSTRGWHIYYSDRGVLAREVVLQWRIQGVIRMSNSGWNR